MIDLPPVLTGLVIAYFDGVLLINTPPLRQFNTDHLLVRCLLVLIHHYQELNAYFSSVNAESFISNRFIPIVAFTLVEMICTFPSALFNFVLNIATGLLPWVSWDNVHVSFSVILVFPSDVWMRGDKLAIASLEMQQWSNSICGVLIFLLFGTTKEARIHYSTAFSRLIKRNVPVARCTTSNNKR